MPVMVALFRGVNVGGHGKLSMAELRAVAEDLGHTEVRSYVQSGNLVFTTRQRSARRVAAELEAAVAAACAVAPRVVVRTEAELREVVQADPYVARGEDPASVHVTFFADRAPSPGDLSDLAPEEAEAIGREVHMFLPSGIGRSKLATRLGRAAPEGTTRNWRTVTTLHAMATGED
jgi:uncharacterized protein (DUF1697 family)